VLGHGTWVAAILLANTDNAFQVAGVDHHAKLLPLKMGASIEELELQALIAALEYLVANPGFAQVVNMSVAGYDADLMLRDALTAAAQTHVLIGGAGNSGVPKVCVGYPNGHPDVITIGATNSTDVLATFTTTGPCLDFVAPGVDIYTASFDDPTSATAFHACVGTSCATPIISGLATLCKALWPAMSQDDFYAALQASAVDLGAPGKDNLHGWGRPNALGTLDFCATIFKDGFESGGTGQWN
jgi:subtilisin family serine protease